MLLENEYSIVKTLNDRVAPLKVKLDFGSQTELRKDESGTRIGL